MPRAARRPESFLKRATALEHTRSGSRPRLTGDGRCGLRRVRSGSGQCVSARVLPCVDRCVDVGGTSLLVAAQAVGVALAAA